MADAERLLVPGLTQWNHPGFFAYFANSSTAAGVLGELMAAALNVNAMLWKTAPAATELELVAVDWLRQLLGLGGGWFGHINDTASVSTLVALAAAREADPALGVRARGMAGRPDLPPLRVYCSEHAHSSVDKAAITLGLGHDHVVKVGVDAAYRMRPELLARAVAADRARGMRPLAVVATAGTTSTASVDPVAEVAAVARDAGAWLHVDASYGGAAAAVPELRAHVLGGAELADSLVVNPHKWLFTPMDCSVLWVRRPEVVRRAFALVPEYLVTAEQGSAVNLMDYGVQLGRRFRALKLWMVLRTFGTEGVAERIRHHCQLARAFAGWVEAEPGWELAAPVSLSLACFRYAPAGASAEAADALNARVLGRGERERRGLPLAHQVGRAVRAPPRGGQRPHRGAARGARLGSCSAPRPCAPGPARTEGRAPAWRTATRAHGCSRASVGRGRRRAGHGRVHRREHPAALWRQTQACSV
jgi:aromatic-L-amino-acid decarboxylase